MLGRQQHDCFLGVHRTEKLLCKKCVSFITESKKPLFSHPLVQVKTTKTMVAEVVVMNSGVYLAPTSKLVSYSTEEHKLGEYSYSTQSMNNCVLFMKFNHDVFP